MKAICMRNKSCRDPAHHTRHTVVGSFSSLCILSVIYTNSCEAMMSYTKLSHFSQQQWTGDEANTYTLWAEHRHAIFFVFIHRCCPFFFFFFAGEVGVAQWKAAFPHPDPRHTHTHTHTHTHLFLGPWWLKCHNIAHYWVAIKSYLTLAPLWKSQSMKLSQKFTLLAII